LLDFIAVLVIARWLAARAQAKGHPGYLAAVGVIGWIVGEALGLKLGELAGLDGAVLVTGLLGAGSALARGSCSSRACRRGCAPSRSTSGKRSRRRSSRAWRAS
jgi:hypothetical protein